MKATGFLDTGVELKNPNFARMAEGDGHQGHPRRGPGRAARARCAEALAHHGPALVDVVSARQELVMPPQGDRSNRRVDFSLFMLKAVMNGRANELLDLARTNLRL